jgi:hypothetical protein
VQGTHRERTPWRSPLQDLRNSARPRAFRRPEATVTSRTDRCRAFAQTTERFPPRALSPGRVPALAHPQHFTDVALRNGRPFLLHPSPSAGETAKWSSRARARPEERPLAPPPALPKLQRRQEASAEAGGLFEARQQAPTRRFAPPSPGRGGHFVAERRRPGGFGNRAEVRGSEQERRGGAEGNPNPSPVLQRSSSPLPLAGAAPHPGLPPGGEGEAEGDRCRMPGVRAVALRRPSAARWDRAEFRSTWRRCSSRLLLPGGALPRPHTLSRRWGSPMTFLFLSYLSKTRGASLKRARTV